MASGKTIFVTIVSVGFCLTNSCIDPYGVTATQADLNYLVVSGFLNGPQGVTTIHLSRTTRINIADGTAPETGAAVEIEGDDGSLFPLAESSQGDYSAPRLNSNPAPSFRLKINQSVNT